MADRPYHRLSDEEYNCLDASCPGHPETCTEERLVLVRALARLHDELEGKEKDIMFEKVPPWDCATCGAEGLTVERHLCPRNQVNGIHPLYYCKCELGQPLHDVSCPAAWGGIKPEDMERHGITYD